mgnify:CR=1 FL=1
MRPGQEHSPLIHPVSLLALALLVVNDHYLKEAYPSFLSGKLSDVAFMILAPLWLLVGARWALGFMKKDVPLGPRRSRDTNSTRSPKSFSTCRACEH